MKVTLTAHLVNNDGAGLSAWLEREFDLQFAPFLGLVIASNTLEAEDYDQPISEIAYHPLTDSFECFWVMDVDSKEELEDIAATLVAGGWQRRR